MDGACRVTVELSLAQLRLERIAQDGSGPFARRHRIDAPSLVYLPAEGGEAALGCFGEPHSHRSFNRFGRVVVVPSGVWLHVRSPGFRSRELVIVRFDEMQFGALTGIGRGSAEDDLAACVDVRAGAVSALMDRLARELAEPGIAREAIVSGLGLVLLGELARHFEGVRQCAGRRTGALADWQIRRIEMRLGEVDRAPPDLAELAALCGIGRRHLMRAWKAATGGTVMTRIEQTRFARALRMLEEDRLPLKAVAEACGFANQSAFGTAFRRRYATTPRDWRTRRRGADLP